MRKEHDQRRLLAPFHPRRYDELVDDYLSAVHEIAVLRLPDDEARWRLHVVAVLESEHRVLRQRAVVHLKGGPCLWKDLEWHVDRAGPDVVQHGMTMTERPALDVLAGEPNAHAVGKNRRKCQLLGRRPIDCALIGMPK